MNHIHCNNSISIVTSPLPPAGAAFLMDGGGPGAMDVVGRRVVELLPRVWIILSQYGFCTNYICFILSQLYLCIYYIILSCILQLNNFKSMNLIFHNLKGTNISV